jgi:hypothetical protein
MIVVIADEKNDERTRYKVVSAIDGDDAVQQ